MILGGGVGGDTTERQHKAYLEWVEDYEDVGHNDGERYQNSTKPG